LYLPKADAGTRTPDPFITSEGNRCRRALTCVYEPSRKALVCREIADRTHPDRVASIAGIVFLDDAKLTRARLPLYGHECDVAAIVKPHEMSNYWDLDAESERRLAPARSAARVQLRSLVG
jgi:hypothetical protein